MCGIYGIFAASKTGLFSPEIDILKQMAIVTSLRGDHSSGIAVLRNDHLVRPWIAKSIGDPFNIFHNPDIMKQLKTSVEGTKGSLGVFGHGRLATRGDITPRNAHPFSEGNITLVHNGTITSGVDMTESCDKGEKIDVDSHALAISMSKIGVAPALRKVNGAYAIIAHDKEQGCIYLARNSERPLSYVLNGGKLYVMSEIQALYFVLERSLKYNKISASDPKHFEADTLYKYNLSTFTLEKGESLKSATSVGTPFVSGYTKTVSSKRQETFLECTGIETSPNNPKEFVYTFKDDDDFEYFAVSSKHEPDRIGQLATTTSYTQEKKKQGNLVECVFQIKYKNLEWYETPVENKPTETGETVRTFNGIYVLKSEFEKAAKSGCDLCSGPIYPNEVGNTYSTTTGGLICSHCVNSGYAEKNGFNIKKFAETGKTT